MKIVVKNKQINLCLVYRIHSGSSPTLVDPSIPNIDFDGFKKAFIEEDDEEVDRDGGGDRDDEDSDESGGEGNYQSITMTEFEAAEDGNTAPESTKDKTSPEGKSLKTVADRGTGSESKAPGKAAVTLVNLDELDNPTGILHVWYLVLEGLASAIAVCPKSYQPQTLEMLFELLRSAASVPG